MRRKVSGVLVFIQYKPYDKLIIFCIVRGK